MIRSVRLSCAFLVLVVAMGTAAARPVNYQVKADVPVGQKPTLRVTATEKVGNLVLALERDDGKQFTAKHGALAKGQSVTLPIGDGAPGKSTYKATLSLTIGGQTWSEELSFETVVRAPLKVTYDADHLDLGRRVLQFKLTRPAASAELVVIGDDGKEAGRGTASYKSAAPDTWLSISWSATSSARPMIMKLRVVAADGLATNVELIPWSVSIDHEDVNFSTDSAVIEPGETQKLDASLAKIQEVIKRSQKFMKMKLYVAGHTDTVGPHAKNRKLSFDRAVAIARYFQKKGVGIPVVVAGYGEEVLRKPTGDNVDERTNRRADYVIGPAAGAPPFKGPYLKARAEWKQLK